ncbi:GAP family protein [Mycobacterium paraterrae]|uniref:GAP family protein n=1 Tax=Mycobacterium paraterrae TaxID=577492 RepID=A0ABY3VDU0_9MYCO|nr:GAP family protein [Mycobacterium paraterrae]UMB67550.1 GAP family protein [Mycobacterium paraterrae]
MWSAVLFFGIIAAQDPVRIGIMALLISRPRPLSNLFAYWLGLMTSGFGLALAALFFLHDLLIPIVRLTHSIAIHPALPFVQVMVGVLALVGAGMLIRPRSVRRSVPAMMPATGIDPQIAEPAVSPAAAARVSLPRLSWSSVLERKSLGMPFVAGLGTSTQLLEFWGAMLAILASGVPAATQVAAALVFTLVAYTITEIPLVAHVISPARTEYVVMGMHAWLFARRRTIFGLLLGALGAMMVAKGVGQW